MRASFRFVIGWLLSIAGCAATGGGPMEPPTGPAPDCQGLACAVPRCPADSSTALSGRVTAPNGQQPIPQALVYIPESPGPLSTIAAALGCEACNRPLSDRTVAVTQTGIDGRFTLRGVPAGERIPVVIQKGRFRRRFEMTIAPCQTQAVTAPSGGDSLPLPGSMSDGDLPLMAVAAGDHDAIECVLRELGIAPGEFAGAEDPSSGDPTFGRVHLYNNQAPGAPTVAGQPPLSTLLRDRERMLRYPLIFLNCSGPTYSESLLRDPQVLSNLRDYLSGGGRLYVTDWSYDFLQQVPELAPFVCFEDDQDCAITTPHGFHTAPAHGGSLSLLTAQISTDTPTTRALADWIAALPGERPLMPGALPVSDLLPGWVVVQKTATDLRYPTTTWLTAELSDRLRPPRLRPLTVSFDYPPQAPCGRALFSSYHTRQRSLRLPFPEYCPATGSGLLPQEHILAFLLFELGSCLGPPA